MRRDVLRRVRWGNVLLASAALTALTTIVVWPLVSATAPTLPPDASRPLVSEAASSPADSGGPKPASGAGRGAKRRGEAARRRKGERRARSERRGGTERAERRRGGTERAERRRGGTERPARSERRAGTERREVPRRAPDDRGAPSQPAPAQPAPARGGAPARRNASGGEFGFEGTR